MIQSHTPNANDHTKYASSSTVSFSNSYTEVKIYELGRKSDDPEVLQDNIKAFTILGWRLISTYSEKKVLFGIFERTTTYQPSPPYTPSYPSYPYYWDPWFTGNDPLKITCGTKDEIG